VVACALKAHRAATSPLAIGRIDTLGEPPLARRKEFMAFTSAAATGCEPVRRPDGPRSKLMRLRAIFKKQKPAPREAGETHVVPMVSKPCGIIRVSAAR
jgi:hypothetical protein